MFYHAIIRWLPVKESSGSLQPTDECFVEYREGVCVRSDHTPFVCNPSQLLSLSLSLHCDNYTHVDMIPQLIKVTPLEHAPCEHERILVHSL